MLFAVKWRRYLLSLCLFILLSSSLISLVICQSIHHKREDESKTFQIRVLHTNDLHSRFDEVTLPTGSKCRDKDRTRNKCVGGVARIKHLVDKIKHQHSPNNNVLFLNAGDFFQVCS